MLATSTAEVPPPNAGVPKRNLVHESWLRKCSKHLRIWRSRWVSLWSGEEHEVICSPHAYNYADVSERFEVAAIGKIWEAPEVMYGRPHCFVIEYRGAGGVRLVAMQALDEVSKRTWISSLLRCAAMLTSATPVQAPLLLGSAMRSVVSESKPAEAAASDPAAASGQPQAQVQQVQQVQVQQVQPSQTSSSSGASASSQDSGKGGSKGPAAPSKGKGAKGAKGKGKGVPPLPVAKGKGKAQPKASANALPFGKRLNMRDSGALPQTARGEQPSIFQGLFAKRAGHAQEDIDTLCSLFSESKASASTAQAAPVQGNVSKAAPRKILPDEKARNCAIVLRGLPLRGPDLVEAVRLLEPGPLEQDHLERLAVIMPEPKVMSEIQSAGEDGLAPLRDVERAMVPFSQLGRLQERLKALILAANLQGQELRLMGQMQVVKAACKQIGESSSLKHVLATVLVMYNYVNFGQVGRSHAHAFDIANLLHLNEFRADRGAPAPFPKFSALHYVAMRLLADESVQSIRTLKTELGRVSEAAGVCLQHVATSIEQLNKDIEKLREEQRANASVYGGAVEDTWEGL